MTEPVTTNSEDFNQSFFGILNAQGQFWTPLAFESERKAVRHIEEFWTDNKSRAECLKTHRIVPVRIQLTAIWARS